MTPKPFEEAYREAQEFIADKEKEWTISTLNWQDGDYLIEAFHTAKERTDAETCIRLVREYTPWKTTDILREHLSGKSYRDLEATEVKKQNQSDEEDPSYTVIGTYESYI